MQVAPSSSARVVLGLLAAALAVAGCSSRKIETKSGRLAFAKDIRMSHAVSQMFLFDGKVWAPSDDKDLANHVNWCDVSPNPAVEALRCYSDASDRYGSTYILTVSDGKPALKKFDENLGSAWIDDEGRWILFVSRFYNIETGEEIPVKGVTSTPANWLLGVSPDKKTILGAFPMNYLDDPSDPYYGLEITDVTTGAKTKKRIVNANYPWVRDDPNAKFAPDERRAASKHVEWKKDDAGRYVVAAPELLDWEPEVAPGRSSASSSPAVAPSSAPR